MNKQNNLRGAETLLCDPVCGYVSAGCAALAAHRPVSCGLGALLRQPGFTGCRKDGTLLRAAESWGGCARGRGA